MDRCTIRDLQAGKPVYAQPNNPPGVCMPLAVFCCPRCDYNHIIETPPLLTPRPEWPHCQVCGHMEWLVEKLNESRLETLLYLLRL